MSRGIFPNETTWITPRTTNAKIDSNNCVIIFPQKISKIDRVLVKSTTIKVSYGTNATMQFQDFLSNFYYQPNDASQVMYLDITDYVVEQAKYNTLPIKNVNAEDLIEDLCANNAHYYVQNDNILYIVGKEFKGSISFWAKSTAWNMAIEASFAKILKNNSLYHKTNNGDFEEIELRTPVISDMTNNPMSAQFRVYYTPLGESVKLKSVKVNPQPQQFTIPFSQQQPIVNNTTIGKEMQSIANRTGCETMQVVRVIPSMRFYRAPGTVYKEKDENGNLTGNVWRLTRCELSIYSDNYINVVETWSKNWTYRSPNVPINREFRSWNIPADIVQRNLHYNDYCIFSRTNLSKVLDDDAIISGESREMLARKIHDQTDIRKEMSNMWFGVDSTYGSVGAVLSCSAFGFGNSIVFSGKTKDNLSAGVQRVNADSNDSNYQFCKDVYYCHEDGKLENLTIQIATDIANNDPMAYPQYFDQTVEQINLKQNAPTGNFLFRTTGDKTNKFHIQKDPSEQLNFTYQLHFLSADGFLVIGSAWAANNELVKTPDTPIKIKKWGLSKAIPAGLLVMTKEYGEVVTDEDVFLSGVIGTGDNKSIVLTINPKNYVGVCVTDENNNVLVAYNNKESATYYGTFTHNYEDIYDALFDTEN